MTVFDSSAIICWLFKEPGAEYVLELLTNSPKQKNYISSLNQGEVIYILMRQKKILFSQALKIMEDLPLTVIHCDLQDTLLTSKIKSKGGISYLDCFALVLAIQKKSPLIVKDIEFDKFKKLAKIVQVS